MKILRLIEKGDEGVGLGSLTRVLSLLHFEFSTADQALRLQHASQNSQESSSYLPCLSCVLV